MPGVLLEGAVLRVSGEVVRGNAPEFKQQLTELLTQVEPALQVDLAGVDTLDTSGLQVLLATRTSALLKGQLLHLCNISEGVQQTLTRSGLDFLQTPPDT